MNTVISGVPVTVYKEGYVKIKNETVLALFDVDGFLKISINNRYYKLQNIIASVFLEYDLSDNTRYVTHIDKNPRNNDVNNLKIEMMTSKRKLENMSIH
jgi:hypothetical protein